MPNQKLTIGIDFGTDSVRALVVDAKNGKEVSSAVQSYVRWHKGLYCQPDANQWRQHPLDYIESLETSVRTAIDRAPFGSAEDVVGIAIDTTGSTPVAVDRTGTPLALTKGFEDDPDAMFILWKDHTAIAEAAEINALCRKWSVDYTKYEGGIYSSEWFWAKILHTLRASPKVQSAAHSWVEHCDWIPFLLTGGTDISMMKRSRCAAGHKALWHPDFGGLPPNDFLVTLDPILEGLRSGLYTQTFTSDHPAGNLSPLWAQKLGLSEAVVIAVGAFDAHMGAVGGEIEPYFLSKVMGTSTCDMLVAPSDEIGDTLVGGICGQVNGSVIPGLIGMEAGQSAFGDVYAWFRNVLYGPTQHLISSSDLVDQETKDQLLTQIRDQLIPSLSQAAMDIDPATIGLVAIDWLNGRRTPDANQTLKGAITGLTLASDAPKIFRALVEATCFGARSIVDRFQQQGVPIKGIIGLGGVAKKSPFIMQIMSSVLNRPIKVARAEQTCALGAAMFAAVAAGLYTNVSDAMQHMGSGFDARYEPDPNMVKTYNAMYQQYLTLGSFVENQIKAEYDSI
ncbi:UNVERIFIED_CONTAM: hypothetical protein GTU68_028361 [Idotea baltica]|nr:hypothetical protein [Idotea baltica]